MYLTLLGAAAGVTTIPAFSPGVVDWKGRVRPTATNSVVFDWVGSAFAFTVTGGSYVVATVNQSRLHGITKFRVFDTTAYAAGQPIAELCLHPIHADYILAGSLPTSINTTVTVVNNQDWPSSYEVELLSLTTDGIFLPLSSGSVVPQMRRMEFIGDSITAATNLRRPSGDPAYGIPQAPDFGGGHVGASTDNNDYPLSYMSQLCTALDANCSTIATGGKGLVSNCCGNSTSSGAAFWGTTMPDTYRSLLGTDSQYPMTPSMDFEAHGAPDAVVINLGTNDYYGCAHWSPTDDACGPHFWALFATTYVELMENITTYWKKPNIHFFAAAGPMLGPNTTMFEAIESAQAMGAAQGLNVTFLNIEGCSPAGGRCDGTAHHPGPLGHKRMYELAYNPIKRAMGW